MQEEFYRIKRLPPYVFAEVNRLKAKYRNEGMDIIDFGMGNPDLPVPQHIVDKLCETAAKPRTNRYSASRGIPGLRKAMAGYYDRRFGVKLNADTQIVSTLGSKEGFANLAQAITAPGDVIISPNPSYPIHAFGFIMAGGVIRSIEAHSPEQYLSGISRAARHSVPPPIAMVTCYPANPSAQTVELDFYKDAVALAKKHEMFLLSDMAYSEIYFEGDPPPSVLQVDGATDVCVEVNTLSKTYSMAGFRVGFALGNELSDHVTERQNYLYLAHSKLRACSFGPELLLGELPERLQGESRIRRQGRVLWQAPFESGEANMSHRISGLEHHHFKYAAFCQPGSIHVHFFGTATLSFAAGVRTEPGDVFEIECPAFGRALENPLERLSVTQPALRTL